MSPDFAMHDEASTTHLLQQIADYEKKLECFNLDLTDGYRDAPITVEHLFSPYDYNFEPS